MSKNNIIEINGKQYDAKTGEPFGSAGKNFSAPKTHPLKTVTNKPTMSDVVSRPKPSHITAHNPKTSQTLMRHSVKKPVPIPKKAVSSQLQRSSPHSIATKKSVKKIDKKRLHLAKQTPQSQQIRHFSPITPVDSVFEPQSLPEKVLPPVTQAVQPTLKSGKPKTTADILELALHHANSHEEVFHDQPKKRNRTKLAGATLAIVLAVSAIGYQQLPNIKLHLASSRAGVEAGLPTYQPAGYSLGKLNYSDGVVATQFHSNSDERSYTLIQKRSDWDSQALKDNYVVSADKSYQTVSAGGRTIYIYGQQNATWVNGGIWYQIQNDGSLSNRQLIDLATSL